MSEAHPPQASSGEHDAWLRQALRHAPDAGAVPPNALREAILAEARSAVRAGREMAPRSSFIDRIAALWSWLARPQVAAGFAGVMAATLVGMMWWDRPMDEALAPPPSRTLAQPGAARPPPAAPTVADALSSAGPTAGPTTAPAPTAPSAFASKLAPTTTAKAAPKAVEADKPRKDRAPMNALQSAPAVSPFPGAGLNRGEAAAGNQAAAPALAKKEHAETRTAAAPPSRIVAPEPAPAAAPAEVARSADAAVADAKGFGASGELAKAAPPQRQRAAIDAAARPMFPLLGSLSGNPERWARPVANGAPAPISAATEAWLASVDAATAGRWQARAERTARLDGALFDDAGALALFRDGRLAAVVRVEEGGVFFELQPGPAWFAPLPADVLARLHASLPAIPR